MFEIFGYDISIKKNKEEEKLITAETVEVPEFKVPECTPQEKRWYEERKSKIEGFLEKYMQEQHLKEEERYIQEVADSERANSVCPKCGSKNIINHIKRTKGNSLYFDTYPVNKCSDCGHEWNVAKAEHHEVLNEFFDFAHARSVKLCRTIYLYIHIDYFPRPHLSEKYNSLEERRCDFCLSNIPKAYLDFYKRLPRYMLEYLLYIGVSTDPYIMLTTGEREIWGFDEYTDCYSYQMPEYVWEVCKKVIGWEEEEE